MANNSLILQLNTQTAQQAMMQLELQSVKNKLEQASKTLAQKDEIIGSLEQDLEHMIDQLVKIQHRTQTTESKWITSSATGIA